MTDTLDLAIAAFERARGGEDRTPLQAYGDVRDTEINLRKAGFDTNRAETYEALGTTKMGFESEKYAATVNLAAYYYARARRAVLPQPCVPAFNIEEYRNQCLQEALQFAAVAKLDLKNEDDLFMLGTTEDELSLLRRECGVSRLCLPAPASR